jgi:hypothetical protein
MKKKLVYVLVFLTFMIVNVTLGTKNQNDNIRLTQLFTVAVADLEGEDDESNVDATCQYVDAEGVTHNGTMVICMTGKIDCTPTNCTKKITT